jgi:hypothetical protein
MLRVMTGLAVAFASLLHLASQAGQFGSARSRSSLIDRQNPVS